MTNKEAADELQYAIDLIKQDGKDWIDERDIPVLEMAISALEKQIPKKLIAEGDGYADGSMVYDSFYCPSCDYHMEDYEVKNFCPNCGQAIYWTEVE